MKSKITHFCRQRIAMTLLLFLMYFSVQAQLSGRVDLEEYGISFTIPERWMGQEVEDGLVLVSEDVAGFIYLSLNSYESVEDLELEMSQGIQEGDVISLHPIGRVEEIGTNLFGAIFEGVIEGDAAKAYGMAIFHRDGFGVNILAATNASAFGDSFKEIAVTLARSFEFTTVNTVDVGLVGAWRERLTQSSLHYLESYSSGLSGGSSARTRIDLCPNGDFQYSSQSSVSIDVGGVSGGSSGKRNGSGTWEVTATNQGGAKLLLQFTDGDTWEFELTTNAEEHTLLNGRRYLRIPAGDPNGYGPNCP
ncbi:MAG: hypothetical protein JJU34_03395 [Lunatimonas sp.]|uniref:hypothetical protein n=1 Tax=Lunatimonas sp. TaxID=2060141 RepID=UPI00263BBC49|nr:hypothetical protein [Lunatimonas sp.]MCC5936307.1 hypothetical protein [Lunatimonas sp.]